MEFLGLLLIAWLIITLVGHGSWVMLRAIFSMGPENGDRISKATESSVSPERRPSSPNSLQPYELDSFRRILARLVTQKLISQEEANSLRGKIVSLNDSAAKKTQDEPAQRKAVARAGAKPPDRPQHTVATSRSLQKPPHPLDEDADELSERKLHPGDRIERKSGTALTKHEKPLQAVLCDGDAVSATATKTLHEPPRRGSDGAAGSTPRADLIRSFLAAHNIRWGELVAGALIVVCSIGLVVSLWNTLTQTHRVIPSLIFLTGNASIFAVGLYTLSRWKLRHSSRAVLVIATLLVPLSILSGLATAGSSGDAVQLTDPITLAAIILSGIVYGLLLLFGGRGLVGRFHARTLLLSVAGPAAVLPLMPAAVRVWGEQAGWVVGLGGFAIAIGLLWDVRLHKRLFSHLQPAELGKAQQRNRLLTVGVSTFALAMLISYAAFLLRDSGANAWLAIAVSSIPAWIAIAGACRWLSLQSREGTMAMATTVIASVACGAVISLLIPAMVDYQWVLGWGILATVTGAVVGVILKRDDWFAAATVPLSLAAVLTSSVWFGQADWSELPVWRRLIGGEPMLAAFGCAAVLGMATLASSKDSLKRSLRWVAIGWAAIVIVLASVLVLMPTDLHGSVPDWTPTALLAFLYLGASFGSAFDRRWAIAASSAAALLCVAGVRHFDSWLSIMPWTWHWWMLLCLAFSTLNIGSAVSLRQVASRRTVARRELIKSRWLWAELAFAASCFSGAFALLSLLESWQISGIGLAVASAITLLSAAIRPRPARLPVSQLISVAAIIVLAYGVAPERLVTRSSWASGEAPLNWIALIAMAAVPWFFIREVLSLPRLCRLRISRALTSRNSSLVPAVDGVCVNAASALLMAVGLGLVLCLAVPVVNSNLIAWQPDIIWILAPLASVAFSSFWANRLRLDAGLLRERVTVLATAAVLLLAFEISVQLLSDDAWQLAIATSLSVAGCIALALGRPHPAASKQRAFAIPTVCGGLILTSASATLLLAGWLRPVLHGELADPLATVTVAGWWLLVAGALLLLAREHDSQICEAASSILLPLSAALIVPMFWSVHPVVWLQVTAIAAFGWLVARRTVFGVDASAAPSKAMRESLLWVQLVGVVSAALATAAIVFQLRFLEETLGWAGFATSVLAVVSVLPLGWTRAGWLPDLRFVHSVNAARFVPLSPPLVLSFLAGYLAWAAQATLAPFPATAIEIVTWSWLIAAVGSTLLYGSLGHKKTWKQPVGGIDFWHAAGLLPIVMLLVLVAGVNGSWFPIAGILAASAGVILVGLAASFPSQSIAVAGTARALGWSVLILGGSVLVWKFFAVRNEMLACTIWMAWLAGCVTCWRLGWPDRATSTHHQRIALPDLEVSLALLAAILLESGFTFASVVGQAYNFDSILFWTRIASAAAVFATVPSRAGRRGIAVIAVGLLATAVALIAGRFSDGFVQTTAMRTAMMLLAPAVVLSLWTRVLPSLGKLSFGASRTDGTRERYRWSSIAKFATATWIIALLLALGATVSACSMIIASDEAGAVYLTIAAVALVAWSLANLAELNGQQRMRHAAITIGLVAVGLMATTGGDEATHRWLEGAMRWLVAATVMIPTLLYLLPLLLGKQMARRWSVASKQGAVVCCVAAGASLLLMLVLEAGARSAQGIAGVDDAEVVGVLVTLVVLSLLSGTAAVLSWQRSADDRPRYLALEDPQRRWLVVAAQGFAAVAWLHMFLCRPHWAFAGLREYWPYVVMALAFASVGVTEWARRRGDRVIDRTLRQTALYLPLVPVIGFWLSGAASQYVWAFSGGKVAYEWLLLLGAVYYFVVAVLWRQVVARVGAIVLANAALWVFLAQTPGWDFLLHPQAWLIPPAACVLGAVHFYHDQIPAATRSAIRYGATLVIYISSTADMLIADIGETLAGPMVLVVLALAGMGLGVVLRIKPFLYLGAAFVLVATTSMVWHAQQAIDQTWPWWVFGITLGLLLLGGLMTLEKNKIKLRGYADELSTWEV